MSTPEDCPQGNVPPPPADGGPAGGYPQPGPPGAAGEPYGAYFTYFHSTPAGQTVGNRVMGIRIVDSGTGYHLDYVRALLRWLMSYVSGIALLIGYLWMLWDPYNQTWHDKVANSYVVKASHHPPPADFGKPASST